MVHPGDFHIHTALRPFDDGAENMLPRLIAAECKKRQFHAFGLSPHWHFDAEPEAFLNFLNTAQADCREILPMYRGAEAECVDASGKLSIPDAAADELDYLIVSGDHFNCTGVVRPPVKAAEHFLFHLTLLLQLAQNPRVDIIAHPLIAVLLLTVDGHLGKDYEPLEKLPAIPDTWLDEFAAALRENHTAIELNGFFTDTWLKRRKAAGFDYEEQYFDFFRQLAGRGVTFSVGSDAHNLDALSQYDSAGKWLKKLNVPENQIKPIPMR